MTFGAAPNNVERQNLPEVQTDQAARYGLQVKAEWVSAKLVHPVRTNCLERMETKCP